MIKEKQEEARISLAIKIGILPKGWANSLSLMAPKNKLAITVGYINKALKEDFGDKGFSKFTRNS